MRDLRERRVLERENGRLVLVGEPSLPAALQETLQARIDRLDPEARELVDDASVIGRSFGLPLLERLLPATRARPTLSELQWLQLVVEERRLPCTRVPLPARARPGGRVRPTRRGAPARAPPACRRGAPRAPSRLPGRGLRPARAPLRGGRRARARHRVPAARRATPPGRSTRMQRRSSSTGSALAFMERTGDDAGPGDAVQDRSHTSPRVRLPRRQRRTRGGVRSPATPSLCGTRAERAGQLGDAGGVAGRGDRTGHVPAATSRTRVTRSTCSVGSSRSGATSRSSRILPSVSPSPTTADVPVHAPRRRPLERRRACHRGRLRVHLRTDGGGRSGGRAWLAGVERERAGRADARDSPRRGAEPLPPHARSAARLCLAPPCPRAARAGVVEDVPLVGNGPFVLTERRRSATNARRAGSRSIRRHCSTAAAATSARYA